MVTVLMAVWQGEEFLREQLDSILSQTVKVDRLVVSDDGSDDGTMELLKQYRQKYPEVLEIVCHEREKSAGSLTGAAANFFFLMSKEAEKRSDEEWVERPSDVRSAECMYWFLSDQDDVWMPDKVECMLSEMQELEAAVGSNCPLLLHSDMKVVDAGGETLAESFFDYQHIDRSRGEFSEILVENPVTGGAAMINRAMLELMKKQPDTCVMHDWWMALAASCFGRIACTPKTLSRYRQHENNTVGAKRTGSVRDLRQRLYRGGEVQDNYRKIFEQAECFLKEFGSRMEESKRRDLQGFLSLPLRSPLRRFQTIRRHSLYKTSLVQTFAQCFTIKK